MAIWAGFAASYEAVRGLTSGDAALALAHARSIIALERRLHSFFEPALQHDVLATRFVADLADWTYWLAQFVVVGIVVVWVYLRRNPFYVRLRDTLIVTNGLGLICYLLFPVAPPRLVGGYGFRDTLSLLGTPNHQSGIVPLFANQYAALPSLHAADALVLGATAFTITTRRALRLVALAWPLWVAFALVVSANHFWLDVVCGAGTAAAGWVIVRLGAPRARRLLSRGSRPGRTRGAVS